MQTCSFKIIAAVTGVKPIDCKKPYILARCGLLRKHREEYLNEIVIDNVEVF